MSYIENIESEKDALIADNYALRQQIAELTQDNIDLYEETVENDKTNIIKCGMDTAVREQIRAQKVVIAELTKKIADMTH